MDLVSLCNLNPVGWETLDKSQELTHATLPFLIGLAYTALTVHTPRADLV